MFRMPVNRGRAGLVLEIAMIVVGINVALWFESWFQDLEDAETEATYLADLRDDLQTDLQNLDIAIENGSRKSSRTAAIAENWAEFRNGSPEEIARAIFVPSNYRFFTPSDFTFRSMQESGDFRLLTNGEVKTGLLKLERRYRGIESLQKNYLQALDDGYIPLMMANFDIATMQVSDPSLFDDQ